MEELVGLLFALLLLYWVIKGTLFLFQRYHALLEKRYRKGETEMFLGSSQY